MMQKSETRKRIECAAIEFCVRSGVNGWSLKNIANVVGIRVPSIYNHFGSKEELISAIFEETYSRYGKRLSVAVSRCKTTEAAICAFVDEVCRIHSEDEMVANFVLLTHHEQFSDSEFEHDNPVQIMFDILSDGARQGRIKGEDVPLMAASIIGTLVQCASFRLYDRCDKPMILLTEQLKAICLRAAGL